MGHPEALAERGMELSKTPTQPKTIPGAGGGSWQRAEQNRANPQVPLRKPFLLVGTHF